MQRAIDLLQEKRELLDQLTKQLIEKEELDHDEIKAVIGPSIHETKPAWKPTFPEQKVAESCEGGDNGADGIPSPEKDDQDASVSATDDSAPAS